MLCSVCVCFGLLCPRGWKHTNVSRVLLLRVTRLERDSRLHRSSLTPNASNIHREQPTHPNQAPRVSVPARRQSHPLPICTPQSYQPGLPAGNQLLCWLPAGKAIPAGNQAGFWAGNRYLSYQHSNTVQNLPISFRRARRTRVYSIACAVRVCIERVRARTTHTFT